MITTQVDSQSIAAGNGGTSTPVKLLLQGYTLAFSVELLVAVTKALTQNQVTENGRRRNFTLWWATSYQSLALSSVTTPKALRNSAKSRGFSLSEDLTSESVIIRDKPVGQYLYVWIDYPESPDAYTLTATATEFFFNSGSGSVTVKTANYTSVSGDTVIINANAKTIKLPATGNVNDSVTIKNRGTAANTVDGNGSNIFSDSSVATYSLVPGESETFVWDGTYWSIV